jgi:acetyl-CoA hydrolase
VAVNSAIEVDLTDQVCSEKTGGKIVAGVGGSVHYFESAYRSEDGLRIIALPTTRWDTVSRIVARQAPGSSLSIPRHSIDAIVREHGVAVLTGRSPCQRAEALLAICEPDLSDLLTGPSAAVAGERSDSLTRMDSE